MTQDVPKFTRQVRLLARAELQVELRAGETFLVALPFAIVTLLLIPLSIGANASLLRQLGAGMYWVVVLLFGALVTVRPSALEAPVHRDLLALLGVDPAARFLARTLTGAGLLALFQFALAPVAVVLYNPDLTGWLWLLVLVPLVALGLATLGTAAGNLTRGVRTRAMLGPLVVLPLALPLLIGASQLLEGAVYVRAATPWLVLVLTCDLLLLLVGLVTATWLEEEQQR